MNANIFNARIAWFWDGLLRMLYSGYKMPGILDSDPEFLPLALVLYLGVLILIMRSFYYLLRRL